MLRAAREVPCSGFSLCWAFFWSSLGRCGRSSAIEREHVRIYIPLATSLLASIVLSLVLWLISR